MKISTGRSNVTFLGICLIFLAPHAGGQTYQYPFQNPATPIEERVTNVVSLLTDAEKLSLLPEREPAIPRLGLGTFTFFSEGLHGLGWGGNAGGRYSATQFPQAYGLGETWDIGIMQQMGAWIAHEARASNNSGGFGLLNRSPNADLGRDPRWGRTEECFGEDPFLVGKMSAALIKGYRGTDPKYFMLASMAKHMMANSNEDDRTNTSSNFDQRLMMEYYGKSFEIACMEGPALCYMTAYNRVNGVDCIFNPSIKKMVRQDWKWDGAVCSDNRDLSTSLAPSTLTTLAQRAAAAIKTGLIGAFDDGGEATYLGEAFSQGLLTIDDIDVVLKNTFRLRIRLGDLDPAASVPYKSITGTPWTSDSAKLIAKLVTQKSIVLLKNSNNTLPLDKSTIKSIAIIGRYADSVLSDWYGGNPPYKIPIRAGITSKVGTGVTINYAADNTGGAAVNAARSSEVAIVVVGNNPMCNAGWATCPRQSEGKEAIDRKTISLEPEDETLVQQVRRANPKTILVLLSSFPYAITWAKDSVPAIVHMTHCSQETGNALADVLFGDYNPAGRLTQTWVRAISDLPTMMDYNIRNGRTYMYFSGTPLYPFGYGRSYTTFSYANLAASADNLCQGSINVSVDITNTGTRAGEEVVQMYVKYPVSTISRPNKQLRGFKRVPLAAGATATVTIPLAFKDVAYWDSTLSDWKTEAGTVQVLMGGSSADTDLKVTRNITVCAGTVGTFDSKPITGPDAVSATTFGPVTIARHGTIAGISVALKLNAPYELNIYDLRGMRTNRQRGVATSNGYTFLPLGGITLGSGLYLVSGTINGKAFSTRCAVR